MRTRTRELVTKTAYLIGVHDELLQSQYATDCAETLEEMQSLDSARIMCILCTIRSMLMQKYQQVSTLIRYELKNLDRIEYFNADDIAWLSQKGIQVIQANTNADKYLIRINQLIAEHIADCRDIYPSWVNWEYIKDLFVIPGCQGRNEEAVLRLIYNERKTYASNIRYYPFQLYIHWSPSDYGNLLNSDIKFLSIVYGLHNDKFDDNSKVMDANDEVKSNIYSFINNSESTAIIVDCENSDVYKLYSVLHNLDKQEISKIKKIILYDDYHTTSAWKLLSRLVDIEVEYIEVERVTDSKSLVDIRMTAGACREFYEHNVKSFILVSSDSDFWGLISALQDADFLVMTEYSKCGAGIKRVLKENNIYYCSIDDFCKGNIDHIKMLALRTELNARLEDFNATGIWQNMNFASFVDDIYRACRIEPTDSERRQFVDRCIKKIRWEINDEGNFCLITKK